MKAPILPQFRRIWSHASRTAGGLMPFGLSLAWVVLLTATAGAATGATFYVSPLGNDAWTGTLSVPNAARSDGPLASLTAARDAVRRLKAQPGGLKEAVRVQIRGGVYSLEETLTFGREDSGTAECPVSYEAFPGEKPVLSGGRQIVDWRPYRGQIQVAVLPEVQVGKWQFRSLFADAKRQIRARYPNFDPRKPYHRGFLFAEKDPNGFGYAVGCIHNPGDWMEYQVEVPRDGEYAFWLFYGASNGQWNVKQLDGRMVVILDGGKPVPLTNLPDTGTWSLSRWSQAATLSLTKGQHLLKWQNVKGGGITFGAFALSDDPAWKPVGTSLAKAAPGKFVAVVQGANFLRCHGSQLAVTGVSGTGSKTEFHFAPGTVKPSWADAPEAEIHIFQSASCRAFLEIVALKGVDEKARTITVGGKECMVPLRAGDRYFVENVLEELDSPGEWYLNRQSGQLFYWPQAELTGASRVVAPRLGRIFQLLGDATKDQTVAHLRFAGLTFQETDYSPDDGCEGYGMGNDGVLYLKDAAGCTIEDCTFRGIGKYAVCLAGGRGNTIRGNDVFDSGEGGLLLLKSAGNTVVDNHLHHLGAVYKHIGGVILEGPGTDDNLVAHNLVHHVSRYGISLKNPGSRNRVEFNRVLNTNLETYDTGGIEVTQHEKEFRSQSTIRNNVVADTIGYSADGPKSVFLSWSIYLDSYAGGYTVSHNVCYRSANGGLMLQGGKDNHVENNIFVGGKRNQMHINNFANNSTGQTLQRNIFYYTDPDAALLLGGKLTPEVIRADRNLYFHAGGKDLVFRTGGIRSFAEWQQRGFDQHSLVADPRFVDPAHDNYALQPDSPAFKLGFEAIDAGKAGLLHPRCHCQIRPAGPEFGL